MVIEALEQRYAELLLAAELRKHLRAELHVVTGHHDLGLVVGQHQWHDGLAFQCLCCFVYQYVREETFGGGGEKKFVGMLNLSEAKEKPEEAARTFRKIEKGEVSCGAEGGDYDPVVHDIVDGGHGEGRRARFVVHLQQAVLEDGAVDGLHPPVPVEDAQWCRFRAHLAEVMQVILYVQVSSAVMQITTSQYKDHPLGLSDWHMASCLPYR